MNDQKLHLISHILCPYVQRSVITLEEKSIKYHRTNIDLANPPSWFLQKSPLSKVPLLIIDEQSVIFESAVICEYIDEITPGSLHPRNPIDKALHRSWIEFGSGILNSIGGLYNAKNKQSFELSCLELKRKFATIENQLSSGPYFSGERFSIVDAAYAPIFRYFDVFEEHLKIDSVSFSPAIQNWRHQLANRKSVKTAVTVDYPKLLIQFLALRGSYLSNHIR